jgi:serine/threonine-protein kinase
MLSAGRHTLDLVNETLAYRASHEVDIKPGEEERLVVAPTGTVNVNALPWAEVWLDGSKLGETPLANMTVPLGTREFVFRHPELGERKLSITVKAGSPVQVSVDLSKP